MKRTMKSSPFGTSICAAFFLAVTTTAMADEDTNQGKSKGKGSKRDRVSPNVVQIDLSKLPPELAKHMMRYAEKSGNELPNTNAKFGGPNKMPPGLANKSSDHPGRIAWLQAHSRAELTAPAPPIGYQKLGNKEKGPSSDLERRLDQLLVEIDALRREVRGKW